LGFQKYFYGMNGVIPSLKVVFKNADRQSSNSYSRLKVQSHSIAMHLKEVIEN
jgi:hypothetical protein